MKIKRLILCILLACAIGISIPLYSLYVHGTLTEIEAFEIGKKVLSETTNHRYSSMDIQSKCTVWQVKARYKFKDQSSILYQDYFVEISKRTGKVIKVDWGYMYKEELK